MSTIPVTYDPPVNDPAEIKTQWVANPEPGVAGYYLQEEPARKLPNLKNTKVLIATADSSFASPGNPGGVAFLKQAGVQAEELRWGKLGIKGNGHMMMMEKNSRQVLQPLIDWMHKNVTGSNSQAPRQRAGGNDSLALKLADTGMFWVGTRNTKKMPYGTIHVGRCSCSTSSRPARIRCRSCSCTAAAARWCTTWASAGCRAGRITSSRPATRSISSIVPVTVARPITPTRSARSVRSSPTTCSRATR